MRRKRNRHESVRSEHAFGSRGQVLQELEAARRQGGMQRSKRLRNIATSPKRNGGEHEGRTPRVTSDRKLDAELPRRAGVRTVPPRHAGQPEQVIVRNNRLQKDRDGEVTHAALGITTDGKRSCGARPNTANRCEHVSRTVANKLGMQVPRGIGRALARRDETRTHGNTGGGANGKRIPPRFDRSHEILGQRRGEEFFDGPSTMLLALGSTGEFSERAKVVFLRQDRRSDCVEVGRIDNPGVRNRHAGGAKGSVGHGFAANAL